MLEFSRENGDRIVTDNAPSFIGLSLSINARKISRLHEVFGVHINPFANEGFSPLGISNFDFVGQGMKDMNRGSHSVFEGSILIKMKKVNTEVDKGSSDSSERVEM